jgi:FtsZ-interacting cell division protein ZipA
MDTTTMIVIALVAVAVIALLVWASARRKKQQAQKREHLRERFGPEFDREVQEQGSEQKAAHRLDDVAKRRDKLEIRELSPSQRERYTSDWTSVQAAFVDAPDAAVRDADRLVGSVMRDRGYPVDDFDAKVDMVRADHPDIADNYRAAHAVRERTGSGGAGTEDLRQAFVHYRALFAELLSDGSTDQPKGEQHRIDLTTDERTTTEEPRQR